MKRKIKVCECVSRLEFGGIETMLLNYLNNFPDKDDYELHIITQNINDDRCIKQFTNIGIIVHIVTHKKEKLVKNHKEIWNILKREKFDIVHCHMTLTNFSALFLAKLAGTKIRISHSHNVFYAKSLKEKYLWNIIKILNKLFATDYMACGKDAAIFLFGKKDLKKVTFVNNAINLDKYSFSQQKREEIKKKYNVNDICIGHVGRFTKQKNHKYIIDIFKDLLSIKKDAKLLLVGSGEDYDIIQNYAKEKGVFNSIIFTGNITNVEDYYNAMDVFILPSLHEGLPIVAIEAQANGLPCILSNRIDRNVDVTKNTYFVNTNDTKQWVDGIILATKEKRKNDTIKKCIDKGYSIKNESSKLSSYYKSKIKDIMKV